MKKEWLNFVALLFIGAGAIYDYRKKRIPLVLPALGSAIALVMQLYAGTDAMEMCVSLIPGLVFVMISFLSGQKVGYGDGLMLCLLGLLLGIEMCTMITLISQFLVCFVMLFLFVLRRVKLTDQIPFLPFLLLGFVCGIGAVG